MSGLRQDDFRKLLATPRSVSQQTPRAAQTPRAQPNKGQKDADGFLKPEPVKPKRKPWKPAHTKSEDDAESGSAYRDRAKERRQGINPDYVETEQMLAVLKASEESQNAHPADQQEPPTPGLSYEQSKYLGGDAKHTHMVKGLDYALLEKVQNDLKLKEAEGSKEKEAREYVEQIHGDAPTSFNSTFAANIYDMAIKKAKIAPPLRNEMFIPGRMAFSWELGGVDETGDYVPTTDVPTTMIRSKADLKDYDKNFTVSSNDLVIEKVISIISLTRAGSRSYGVTGTEKKRVKRKDKERAIAEAEARKEKERAAMYKEAPEAEPEDDEEEDIFADAGREYTLQAKERIKKDQSDASNSLQPTGPRTTPYFQDADGDSSAALVETEPDAMDVDQLPTDAEGSLNRIVQQSVGMLNALEGSGAAERIVGKLDLASSLEIGPEETTATGASQPVVRKRRRNLPGTTLDGADPHDSHIADLADLDDSGSDDGDEADLSQMDLGVKQNKRRQLQRFDFDTEEEWHRYKDAQVHLPKAAFQYGVKASDGRQKSGAKRAAAADGGGTGGGGKKNYDAKLNKEFQQLNKIYSQKYGTELNAAKGAKNKRQKR